MRVGAQGASVEQTQFDPLLVDIADFVTTDQGFGPKAYEAARLCLMDSLACALQALDYPSCVQFLGPIAASAALPGGARVARTALELEPVQAAFNVGCLIRWLDFNDTWLAAEWGHPSDNLGGILATGDYVSRKRTASGEEPLLVSDVLTAMIKAYEIQGILALDNSFNRLGLDHVILVRVATAAVATHLLGGSRAAVMSAVSNAWIDGGTLRVYRHTPNAGPRKSWAAGDATARGVWLALMALRGEPGYPTALTTRTWGYHDALNRGRALSRSRAFGSYVIENVLFKVGYPAEFHAQTAVEAVVQLHPHVRDHLDDVTQIRIETQVPALRIINKTGPLRNPADRDHCLQYIVAVTLIKGSVTADDYGDPAASDERIDQLRDRTVVVENPQYSRDYLDSDKRSVANAVQVFFKDGSATERVEVQYPLGHPRRRAEAVPLLWRKFEASLAARWPGPRVESILERFRAPEILNETAIPDFVDWFVAA